MLHNSEIVVRAEALGKQYRRGEGAPYFKLSERIGDFIAAPFRRFTRRRSQQDSNAIRIDRDDDYFWAIRDVSFEVRRGDVMGVVGRNGSGKSTLLKILSRITVPTEGTAEITGRIGSLLEVGTGFHPELTGRENVFLNGAILGMKRTEIVRNFHQIVSFAEIEEFIDTPVKRYSSGMYMRLAFAVAAHLNPEILLIDEVLAVGDMEFQKRCLGKMQDVASNGRTVFFVSHNLTAVDRLCNSAIILDKGRVVTAGRDVAEIIRNYTRRENAEEELAVWRNDRSEPDNDMVYPHSIRITNEDGETITNPAQRNRKFFIEISAEITRPAPGLCLGCAVFTDDGSTLFWSYQTDAAEADQTPLHPGLNTIRTPIPELLLNEGTYRIELISGIHFREWYYQPGINAPACYLEINGGLSESPLWTMRRPGSIAPILSWDHAPSSNQHTAQQAKVERLLPVGMSKAS